MLSSVRCENALFSLKLVSLRKSGHCLSAVRRPRSVGRPEKEGEGGKENLSLSPLTQKLPSFPLPFSFSKTAERASEGARVESGKSEMEMNGSVQP